MFESVITVLIVLLVFMFITKIVKFTFKLAFFLIAIGAIIFFLKNFSPLL